MNNFLATNITKEDFKRALNSCFKEAWVWHSAHNFKEILNWQNNKQLIYYGKIKINDESDFKGDGLAIDLFKIYQEGDDAQQQKFLKEFVNPEGFSYERFLGETLEDGFSVGIKARELFNLRAQKEKLQLPTLDLSDDNFLDALNKTKTLLNRKIIKYSYGFELAFSYDHHHLKIRPDILKFKPNKHVDIIEIKATTKAKREHFFDLAYQIYVLEKNGLIVDNAFLGHLNPNFIWEGENPLVNLSEEANQLYAQTPKIEFLEAKKIFDQVLLRENSQINSPMDLESLFLINPEFKKIRGKEQTIITYIEAYRQLNKSGYLDNLFKELTTLLNLSSIEILPYLKKNFCLFHHKYKATKKYQLWMKEEPELFCYHLLPWFDTTKETIFNLLGAVNFTKHHKAKIFLETGFIYLKDIESLSNLENKLINWKKPIFLEPHYRHFEVYKKYWLKGENFKETSILKKPLEPLQKNLKYYEQYPIFMYDFETAKWAIPRFVKSKSYQQIPFQYSIDVLFDDNYNYLDSSTMKHYDFLATERIDPRPQFIHAFLSAVLSHGPAKYVAYNDSFEKMVLKQLAFLFPEYQIPLLYVVQNTIDLMTFFKGKKNRWPWFEIYHPNFHGSYSIKKTQPALEPKFDYDQLSINKGDQASQTFREFVDGYLPIDLWKEKIYFDLLKYCNHDTLAMVVLLQRIQEIYRKEQENYAEI